MRNLRFPALAAALLVLSSTPALRAQTNPATGVWLATDVNYAPWVFRITQDGTNLTGTAEQNGAVSGRGSISEGTLSGAAISFKLIAPGAAFTVTFEGTLNGGQLVLNRSGGNPIGNGLFGALAAPQLILKRGTEAEVAAATTTPGAAVATRTSGPQATPPPPGTQRWVASEGVAFKPWILDLKIDGASVTGAVSQANADPPSGYSTTVIGPFPIYDGTADGNKIDFKVSAPGGARIVTFHGVRGDDAMAFTRSVEVVGGDPGRDGILGASGATQFIASLKPDFVPQPVQASSVSSAAVPRAAATSPNDPRQRWQAAGVPNGPWVFDFVVSGASVTGAIHQSGLPANAMSIAAGKIDGQAISFKVLSPDGERVITFLGRIAGDEISFVRQITVVGEGTRGGNDLYGGSAPLQFVATRTAAPGAFNFKSVSVDISSVASSPTVDAIIESLRAQIDIIDDATTDPELKAFLKSVPLIMAASPGAAADNAAYSGAAKGVVLQSLSYSPEKPVILHELLHAYHDQKMPNGFGNTDIQNLYQQAQASGRFPANSYMLSNVAEYFAMMASVYLHGSAARDPFTRQDIMEKQPDCYQWLLKEFGPR